VSRAADVSGRAADVSGRADGASARGGRASGRRATAAALDAESRAWLRSLRSEEEGREEAIARLHALLLRAARFEMARRRSATAAMGSDERDELALQCADDALVAVLAKLDRFRGGSRFTTWAYKFALLETAVKLRQRRWEDREIPVEPAHWELLDGSTRAPHAAVEQRELLDAVARAIDSELSARQRSALIAVALNGVPIDVLAERLDTTRGALYKTIHDARVKLRRRLAADGHLGGPPGEG